MEMEKGLGGRIKEVRQLCGLTQSEFAESLGVVQGYLSAVERGNKNVSETLVIALCHLYGINKDWLKTGKGEKLYGHGRLCGFEQEQILPFLRHLPAGLKKNLVQNNANGSIFLDKSSGDLSSYAFFATGDFMAPTICDGDVVIISTTINVSNGDVVLVNDRWGEPFLRRYKVVGQEVFMCSDNHLYAPFVVDKKLKILGKAIVVWRKMTL